MILDWKKGSDAGCARARVFRCGLGKSVIASSSVY